MLPIILAMIALLAPNRDASRVAQAISTVVESERPLFKDDNAKTRTAALIVAVSFREGSFREKVTGDHGNSFCTMQINRSIGGNESLNDDPEACIRTGISLLRQSMRICPASPIAWYAEGPKGCDSPRAQRISADRMAIAAWLVRKVQIATQS
jgi:hypothetical protein